MTKADLTVVPYAVYKTTAESAFCPVRDLTLSAVATNDIWLSWAITLMEHRRSRMRGQAPETDPRFVSRRRSTYNIMRRRIAEIKPETPSDDTVFGIIAAGIAECRISGKEVGDQHLEAGLTLWKMQRESTDERPPKSAVELIPCDAFIGLGVRNFFKNYTGLITAGHALTHKLESIEAW